MTNDKLQALIDTLESALAVWPEVEKVGFRKGFGLCYNCYNKTRIIYNSWIQEMAKSYRGYSGTPEYPIKLKGRGPAEVYGSKDNLYTGQYGRNRKNFAKYLVRTAKAQLKGNKP